MRELEMQETVGRTEMKNKLVLVVSKGTMDAAYPALILATTAAAQGMEVYMYFTFGGMKLLTKGQADSIEPSKDLGMTSQQLKELISKGGMPTVQQMLQMAADSGVHINACSPTMQLFGTNKENLTIPNADVVGAATFLEWASDPSAITLFI